MATNVCVFTIYFPVNTHHAARLTLRFSWTRDDRRAHKCVHTLYIMRTWRVYTFYILLFNIDIKYIYCKKTIFIIFMSTFFTVIYLHVINVFLLLFFYYFFIHNPNFSNSACWPSGWYDIYVFFCLPIDMLKNCKK